MNATVNIFEQASRKKLRFPSIRGELNAEMLWDLPLTSKQGFDLDNVAKSVNANLKSVTEDSFVSTTAHPMKSTYELQLDVVKHIIAVKQKEAEDAKSAALRAVERERLTSALHQKNEQELLGMSKEDIQKRLAELG